MNITSECVECIKKQTLRVCDAIDADSLLRDEIARYVKSFEFDFSRNPPENATPIYQKMSQLADKADLYSDVKKEATEKALGLMKGLKESIEKSDNKLYTATKIAVAGNVIDLASEVRFDLDEELKNVLNTPFSIDDFNQLNTKLASCAKLLIIGDNAGEHIFDLLFMHTIKHLYPSIEITYMTRGSYIINDITREDTIGHGFEEVANVIDSGVPTPGFVYYLADETAQKIFNTADVVITKGMGNYECLNQNERDIIFLLKVKCQVVANSLQQSVGDLICYDKS